MTDIQHKPKGWNEPQNIMSEDEWREYFRLREVLDVEMNEEELKSSLLKVNELLKAGKKEEAKELMFTIPTHPRYAYQLKKGLGIKEVMYLNLSEAKKVYPNEF